MKLEFERYEEIKKEVIQMFKENNIKCTPINAFEIAIKLGIEIRPYSALSAKKIKAALRISLDGFSVETSDNKWIIYYNDQCRNFGRINQTIMHEIGHFILGHIKSDSEEEAEAKFFAKYALAPPPLIHKLLKGNINPQSIMNTFDLSYTAAVYANMYYFKWLKQLSDFSIYEKELVQLFN